jgi:spore coat protein H
MKLLKTHIYKNIIILTVTCIHPFCLAFPANDELTLKDKGLSIDNKIELYISKAAYKNIKNTDGNKNSLRKPPLIINGDSISFKDIHTRGNTTLYYRRKSFSFSPESKATFHHGDRTESMKKFYAISLSMDKNYIRNRLAFGMMEEIGLFNLFYSYAELEINDNSEGIYMILERPQDWAMKKKNSPLVIRRGYNQRIDKIKTGKKIEKPEAKNYKNYYKQIYKSLNKYEGRALYDTLSQWLDLELYMKWLAFNYIVKNGDYTDEVYFCIDPNVDEFKFIPWYYDDIFAFAPHEGMAIKKDAIGDKFIFSS